MEEELQTCNMEYLSISVITVLCILALIAGKIIFLKVVELLRSTNILPTRQKPLQVNLHREVAELRRNTRQISQDWGEMINLMTSIKDQQSACRNNFKNELRFMSDTLQDNINWSLEEEFTRNDERFSKIIKRIDFFRSDLSSLKEMIRKNIGALLKDVEEYRPLNRKLSHGWTQTEKEILIKRKTFENKAMENKSGENSVSKPSSSGIKRVLLEFQKEARKHALREREEVMRHMTSILNQINEDREVINNTIQQAFAASSYQSQKHYERFGKVGQEALQYIADKAENSNMNIKDKFQEFDKKLSDIFEGMNMTNFDVTSIRNTLDNIDSQLCDIFQRVELGSLSNVEHCEEVLGGLEMTTEVWKENSSRLTEMTRQISDITTSFKNLMNELKGKTNQSGEFLSPEIKDDTSEASAFEQGIQEREMHLQSFISLQNMVQQCSDKVSSLNNWLEDGTGEIKKGIENLLRQISFMCDLVENMGERFKFVETNTKKEKDNGREKELFGEIGIDANITKENVTAPKNDALIAKSGGASKTTGGMNLRSSKKIKPAEKIKQTNSPIRKGKTIYSQTSSPNKFGKNHEPRNQGTIRKG